MEELLRLDTESLKNAAQKLWRNMCAPTCDGTLIPADVYRAFRDGAASGIRFIIGIPRDEMQVYRSVIGDRNYTDGVLAAAAEMQNCMDELTNGLMEITEATREADARRGEAVNAVRNISEIIDETAENATTVLNASDQLKNNVDELNKTAVQLSESMDGLKNEVEVFKI